MFEPLYFLKELIARNEEHSYSVDDVVCLLPEDDFESCPIARIQLLISVAYQFVQRRGLPAFKQAIAGIDISSDERAEVRLALILNKWCFQLSLGSPMELLRVLGQREVISPEELRPEEICPEEMIELCFPIFSLKELRQLSQRISRSFASELDYYTQDRKVKIMGGFLGQLRKFVFRRDTNVDDILREKGFVHIEEFRTSQGEYNIHSGSQNWRWILAEKSFAVVFPYFYNRKLAGDWDASREGPIWVRTFPARLDYARSELLLIECDAVVGSVRGGTSDGFIHDSREVIVRIEKKDLLSLAKEVEIISSGEYILIKNCGCDSVVRIPFKIDDAC